MLRFASGWRWCTCCSPASAQSAAAAGDAASGIAAASVNLNDFITHLVPNSIFEAMANNEILQIVVFSVFFGVALAAMGEQAKPVVDMAERVSHVMLRVTGYVMMFAPFAVFAAIAATVTENGLEILGTYGKFIGGFYLALLILWVVLLIARAFVRGPRACSRSSGFIREPVLLAFSTASSEAAYPATFEATAALRRLAADRRLRAAAGLFVQSRRLDDVLHLRDAVHRPGVRH